MVQYKTAMFSGALLGGHLGGKRVQQFYCDDRCYSM